jgi:hypothetical protein
MSHSLTIKEVRNIIRKGDTMAKYAQESPTVDDIKYHIVWITPYTTDRRRLVKVGAAFDTAKRTLGEWRVCEGEAKAE